MRSPKKLRYECWARSVYHVATLSITRGMRTLPGTFHPRNGKQALFRSRSLHPKSNPSHWNRLHADKLRTAPSAVRVRLPEIASMRSFFSQLVGHSVFRVLIVRLRQAFRFCVLDLLL